MTIGPFTAGPIYDRAVSREAPQYRSRQQVWRSRPGGGYDLLYDIGSPIPLSEAVRQRQVDMAGLTDAQLRDLLSTPLQAIFILDRTDVGADVRAVAGAEADRRKAPKGPPRDKMLRESQVQTKGARAGPRRGKPKK